MTEVFVLGEEDDPGAPAVVVLEMPPGYVLFRHAHPCHRFETVLEGSMRAGDRVLQPGDTTTAAPGEWYGPHEAGPEGCTTIEVFSSSEGVYRVLAETEDGPREFDFRSGEFPPDYRDLFA